MKKLTPFLICLFILITGTCYAAGPYLTSDPYPVTVVQPTFFLLRFDGSTTPINSTAYVLQDGSRILLYDMAGLATGQHTVIAQAANEAGVSGDSQPFPFPIPYPSSAPGSPTLKIIQSIPPGAVPLGATKRSK